MAFVFYHVSFFLRFYDRGFTNEEIEKCLSITNVLEVADCFSQMIEYLRQGKGEPDYMQHNYQKKYWRE